MSEQTTIPDEVQTAPIADALQTVETSIAEFSKVSAGLSALREAHPVDLICAVGTPGGMREAIAGRAAWRDPRIELEKMRKAAKAPVIELGRLIDSTAAQLETELRIGEENYDSQIRAELTRKEEQRVKAQEAERARIQEIKDTIARLFTSRPARMYGASARAIEAAIQSVVAEPLQGFIGFEDDASDAQAHALEALRAMHTTQLATEAREAEQARIALEQAEQTRLLNEARAKFEAEQQAHREELERKAAALKAEADEREAAARAERVRVEAEQRAERERIAAAQKILDDARRAEADRLAAIERARLDADAAAERAEADRVRVEADNKAAKARAAEQKRQEAERRRLAAEALRLERLAGLAPRMLAALKGCVAVADRDTDEFIEARAVIAEAEGAAS